ncbi:MAG: hypothetical protein AAGA80_04830 [Cyanobacteria bacterium P01_F01_bin.143]
MAIIALKAWYLSQYEPIRQITAKPSHLRLSCNSLLKTGMRADFLDDREQVQSADWFESYLEGKTVEFYIEGSGFYVISNIDLVSQEIYFTKQESLTGLEPVVYFSPQVEYGTGKDIILPILESSIAKLSQRSRIPLQLEIATRPKDSPLRLSNSQFKKIRKSLIYIADITAIATSSADNYNLLPSPNVCIEMGYALESKDQGQILLLCQEREDMQGTYPFDVPGYKELKFRTEQDLQSNLPKLLELLLEKFTLFR